MSVVSKKCSTNCVPLGCVTRNMPAPNGGWHCVESMPSSSRLVCSACSIVCDGPTGPDI